MNTNKPAPATDEQFIEMAACALAMHQRLITLLGGMYEMSTEKGIEMPRMIPVPVTIMVDIADVLGALTATLCDRDIITENQMVDCLHKQAAERAAEQANKPEGWCENCQEAHEGNPEENTHLATRELISALLTASEGEPEQQVEMPHGATLH